jgi:hypothetical protein
MRIKCLTHFDITYTGITGHFRIAKLPFIDQAGNNISDEASWTRARNQQRNWETVNQLTSMRTQMFDVSPTVYADGAWTFEFEVESNDVFLVDGDPVGSLKSDSEGTPMLTNLRETSTTAHMLITTGPDQNIWFSQI